LEAFAARREPGIFSFFGLEFRMTDNASVAQLKDHLVRISCPIWSISLAPFPDQGRLEKKYPEQPRLEHILILFYKQRITLPEHQPDSFREWHSL
jgi:hypothetical protein